MRKNVLTGVSKERIEEIMAKRPKDMDSLEFKIYKRVLFEEWNGRNRVHARQSIDKFKKWSKDFASNGHPDAYFIPGTQTIQVSTEENTEMENIAEITTKPEYFLRSNKYDTVIKQVQSVIDANYDEGVVDEFTSKTNNINDLNKIIKIASEYVEVKDLRQKKNIEESSVPTTETTTKESNTEGGEIVDAVATM